MNKKILLFVILAICVFMLPAGSVQADISDKFITDQTIDNLGGSGLIDMYVDRWYTALEFYIDVELGSSIEIIDNYYGSSPAVIKIGGKHYTFKLTGVSGDGGTWTYYAVSYEKDISGMKSEITVRFTRLGSGSSDYNFSSNLENATRCILSCERVAYEDEAELNSLETLIADMFNGLANGLNSIVAGVLGRLVTIDDLVFDTYPETKLTYFKRARNLSGDSTIIWGATGTEGLRTTVNEWYNIFRKIAIIIYMLILVYMGIRIMLSSTGQNLAQYKTLFMYWVIGIMILFLYPYVMKYTIMLNEAFVTTVRDSKDVIIGQKTISSELSGAMPSASVETSDSQQYSIVEADVNPWLNDKSYMGSIATQANNTKRLALSLAYIIMTWQLIILIMHYYKRVLITGLLIVIFPLVAASYAIDRVADGKSQSFSKWNKEFILNVFIQSFHAIVYVFVCATVYIGSGVSGETDYDFILIMVGVTFLFTGEEIIKKIFSQESPSGATKSLAATAAGTMVAVQGAKKIASGVTKPFIGKNSIYNKMSNAKADLQSARAKGDVADRFATESNPGAELEHTEEIMAATTTEEREHAREVTNAVAAMNNPSGYSKNELAKAYEIVQNAAQNPDDAHLLRDLQLSDDQLNEMRNLSAMVAARVAEGATTVTIDREVKLRMGYIIPGDTLEANRRRNDMLDMFWADMSLKGTNRGFTGTGTRSEMDEILGRINSISTELEEDPDVEKDAIYEEDERYSQELLERIRGTEGIITDATDKEKSVARSAAMVLNLGSRAYSQEEYLRALEELNGVKDDEMFKEVYDEVNEEIDIGLVEHVLANKILSSETASDEQKTRARKLLESAKAEQSLEEAMLYSDEFSIHELVDAKGDEDKTEEIYSRIHGERRKTNQKESEITRKMAEDIMKQRLAEQGLHDMNQGRALSERTFEGKTMQQLDQEARDKFSDNLGRFFD